MDVRARALMRRASRFDLRHVRMRYRRNYGATAKQAALLERELKRYLVLRARSPHMRYGMVGPTDDLWHTFILFTRDYARFCEKVAGQFLHHTPGLSQSARHIARLRADYVNFRRDYSLVYGAPPPASVWPPAEEIRLLIAGAPPSARKNKRRVSSCK